MNQEKYNKAFTETFEIGEDQLVGHMSLIAALEEAFDIMIDTDDIIDFNSYEKGMEILSANYEVKF